MASDRANARRGLGAVAAAAGLIAAGAVIAAALDHGFYGTVLVAALAGAWLTAGLWWRARTRDEGAGLPAGRDDGEDERVMLRTLLDQAPGALLAIEGGAHVRALNRAARALFATDDRVLPAPPALLSAEAARLHHGGRRWRIDRVAVHGAGLDAPRTLVALIDVEPEEHAAEARATRDLLRVLGHEVMNAMAPITSLAESALAVLAVPQRRDRLLPEILGTLARRADGLRRFTEAYRQVGRLPEPVIVPVAVADLLADLARLFDAEWQGAATLVIADADPAVAALDRGQIVQALLALVRNGAEAGRAVTAPPVVRVAASVAADRLSFHVSDDGPGIDPAHRSAIFLPFFTTKPDGNGIGLAAARQIAQGHGGDVTLQPGPPTTFVLSLPM